MSAGKTKGKQEGEKHAGGRPPVHGAETRELILSLLMEGKTLTNICRLDTMPKYSTVCQWLSNEPEFAEKYTRAREVQADYFADETVDIADNELDPAVAKIKIDARKWHAGKTRPKKYGDKITHAGDSENPLVVQHRRELSEEELLAIASKA